MLTKSNKKGLDKRKYYIRLTLFVLLSATLVIYGVTTITKGDLLSSIGSVLVTYC
ncbi:Uncharacterised protein [Candidatus Tiddalikarchaeum anstoanum]|nr:Uncharacterised protein [Candidatus Tiddalikarchaeum anstoanum]